MKIDQKRLEKSQLEITFELTEEEFKEHMKHAVEHLSHHVKVDGFRPGKAPSSMVENKLKPEALLMEAGDHAVQHVYVDYIKESKLEPVGSPEVSILKIAQGSPFMFKAVITVLPDVELPDYKAIAKSVKGKNIEVTEQEVQDSINYLQKTRAKFTVHNNPAALKDFVEIKYYSPDLDTKKFDPVKSAGEAGGVPPKVEQFDWVNDKFVLGEAGFMPGFEDGIVGLKTGEEKEVIVPIPKESRILEKVGIKFHEGMTMNFKIKVVSVQKMELPELNDEFAKQLGAFDTLVALKTSMKEGITLEKKEAEKQRVRGEILEKIAEKVYPVKSAGEAGGAPSGQFNRAGFEMPEKLIEYETQRMLEEFKHRVTEVSKISFEEYLASVKKTEAEIKETYQKEAEKRLKGFLVLRELGKLEKVEVSDKEVEDEVAKSIKNYSKESRSAEAERGSSMKSGQLDKINIGELKEYTKGVIQNEKIFQVLENLSK